MSIKTSCVFEDLKGIDYYETHSNKALSNFPNFDKIANYVKEFAYLGFYNSLDFIHPPSAPYVIFTKTYECKLFNKYIIVPNYQLLHSDELLEDWIPLTIKRISVEKKYSYIEILSRDNEIKFCWHNFYKEKYAFIGIYETAKSSQALFDCAKVGDLLGDRKFCHSETKNIKKISYEKFMDFVSLLDLVGCKKFMLYSASTMELQTDSEFPLIGFKDRYITVENLMDQIKQNFSFDFVLIGIDAPNRDLKEKVEEFDEYFPKADEGKSSEEDFYHFKDFWEINTGHIAFCCAAKNTKSFGNDLNGGYFTKLFIEYFAFHQNEPFPLLLQGLKEKLSTTEIIYRDTDGEQKTHPGIEMYFKSF